MTALAQLDDIADLLRRDLATDEAVAVEALLEQATSIIQAETRQTLLPVTDDIVNLAGSWGSVLDLPERPVVDVTGVAVDGIAIADGAWRWNGGWQLLGGTTPILVVNGPDFCGSWGGPERRVTVTYSHGYAVNGEDGFPPLPAELATMCKQMVYRSVNNPSGATSMTVGDASLSGLTPGPGAGGLFLTEWERGVLHKYRP